jgi:hypothetical protein
MKFYNIDTVFNFGKYAGKTVREVLDIQPSYIDWCVINLEHFYILPEDIDHIKSIKPDFTLSEDGLKKLVDKYSEWDKLQTDILRNNGYGYDYCEEEEEDEDDEDYRHDYNDYNDYDNFDWKAEAFDALTDGMCGDYYDDYDGNMDFGSLTSFLGYD